MISNAAYIQKVNKIQKALKEGVVPYFGYLTILKNCNS
jgi:hypothetical protein